MNGQYLVQAIFMLAGITSLLASILNWDWFFTSHNTRGIVKSIGRKRARICYGALGVALMGAAIYFFLVTRAAFMQQATM